MAQMGRPGLSLNRNKSCGALMLTFTSAIHEVHGNVAPTKTPMAYCANTSQKAQIFPHLTST